MSSPNIQAFRTSKTKSPFVPRKPEIVTIGRTSVSLYPKVDSSMTDPEKALAYKHNKTVLASADLDQRARILTLAERLDFDAHGRVWTRRLGAQTLSELG
jgi:hypothetical protein